MHVSEGYTDKPLTKAYDFSLPVRSDLTLYAKWEAHCDSCEPLRSRVVFQP